MVPSMEGMTIEGSSIVEAFPFVLSLPEWFPGGGFRRKAAFCHQWAMQLIEEPFQYARKREAMGSSASAMALDFLKRPKIVDDPLQLQLLKDTCATAFEAGTDTTSSTLMYFMLAMVQNPKVQEQAHAEIDTVIGPDRLPAMDDRPNLPYIEAILVEILRMYTVVPLGVPHSATADDTYENFFIPKGFTLVANVWAMCHDEAAYPEPDVFKPERFLVDGKLREDAKFIDSVAFGFGRRTCPGRYVADASIWTALVSILWAFKITKALNERGEQIDFEPTFRYGVATAPHPFPCSIIPRRENKKIRLLSTVTDSEPSLLLLAIQHFNTL
ncbi:cytochrome P450 [Chiua virens]|nr:cytochrome P450 [Chiua virens]